MATAPQKEALWIFPKALKLLSCLGERGLVASWYWPPGSWKDALWLVEEPEEECGGLQNLLMVELPTHPPRVTPPPALPLSCWSPSEPTHCYISERKPSEFSQLHHRGTVSTKYQNIKLSRTVSRQHRYSCQLKPTVAKQRIRTLACAL